MTSSETKDKTMAPGGRLLSGPPDSKSHLEAADAAKSHQDAQ